MDMKHLAGLAFGLALIGSLSAATNYVDCVNGVDDTNHGTSATNAYATINYAVDKAAAGSVIYVLPGVYDKGGTTTSGQTNRVYVAKSNLTIVSTEGKEKTHIVGCTSPVWAEATNGVNSARCVYVKSSSSFSVTNVVLKGFTLRDGAASRGGAVNVYGDHNRALTLVDCTVSNCVGDTSVLWFANTIRTLVTGNRATATIVRGGIHGWSVFTRNSGSSTLFTYFTRAVNCTMVENSFSDCCFKYNCTADEGVYNCYVQANHASPNQGSNAWRLINCVTTSSGSYALADSSNTVFSASEQQLMNHYADDWRVMKATDSETRGDAAYLAKLPEGEAYKDFFGNAVPQAGSIAVGAIQSVATPVCGVKTSFADGTFTVDGSTASSSQAAYYDTWPKQVRIKAMPSSGKPVAFYGVHDLYPIPDKDDSYLLTLSPSASETVVDVYPATDVLYVNKETGNDEYDGLSAEVGENGVGPKRTIQAAVDAAPKMANKFANSSYAVVYVAPGVYDEGGRDYYGSNRVCVVGKYLRLVATGSAQDTFIVGESDPEMLDETDGPGVGSNAVRCVYWNLDPGGLQGFTLTGGRTWRTSGPSPTDPTKTSEYNKRGAGFCAFNQEFPCVFDCVISNNIGNIASAAFSGWLSRCRVVENDHLIDNYDMLRNCRVVASLVCDNKLSQNPAELGADVTAYNCTVTSKKSLFRTKGTTTTFVMNCLFFDAFNTYANPNVVGCLYDNVTDETATSGYVRGNAAFVDRETRDLRLTSFSDAIGVGANGTEDGLPFNAATNFYRFVSGDIDGNPIQFTNGKPTAGAFQRPLLGVRTSGRKISPAAGVTGVEPGGTLDVTATGAEKSPGWTWIVNGEKVRNGESVWQVKSEDRAYGRNESVDISIEYDPLGMLLLFR